MQLNPSLEPAFREWLTRIGACRLSESQLPDVPLPDEHKRFLTHTGLPRTVNDLFEAQLPPPETLLIPAQYRDLAGQWFKIGMDDPDYGTDICLEPVTGHVMSIDEARAVRDHFVNSDVARFCYFLYRVSVLRQTCAAIPDESIATPMVKALRDELTQLDPDAFADRNDCFWSEIFQQVEAGLL